MNPDGVLPRPPPPVSLDRPGPACGPRPHSVFSTLDLSRCCSRCWPLFLLTLLFRGGWGGWKGGGVAGSILRAQVRILVPCFLVVSSSVSFLNPHSLGSSASGAHSPLLSPHHLPQARP